MSLVHSMLQPIESVFFPYSKAIVGHTIPGVLVRYPVRIVNYQDYTSALRRQKKLPDPVTKFPTKFPSMHEENAKGHPMMQTLRKLLTKKGPTLQKGYQRMTEDLGWRGFPRPAPTVPVPPGQGALPPNLG